ncbi:hypothetical protein AAZX31_07G227800 [Glycine max]
MAKKKSWFSLLKRLFIWGTHSTQDKKEKRRKWIFGRLKSKRLPSIKAPLPSKGTTLSEAEKEQSKHALTVAIASAAVAEAAVTAAHVAAEVVCLTGQCKENSEESQPVQTAFRGYLARKALRLTQKGVAADIMLDTTMRGYIWSIQDEDFSALSFETMKKSPRRGAKVELLICTRDARFV